MRATKGNSLVAIGSSASAGSELTTLGRALRLDLAVRLRSVGPLPWLALVAWGLIARAQEPTMLRDHGIHLACHSVWTGAALLVTCLAVGGGHRPQRAASLPSTVIIALALTLLIGFAQAVLVVGLDLGFPGQFSPGAYAASFGLFVAAWLPLVLVWVIPSVGRTLARWAVQLVTSLFAALLASSMWRLGWWAVPTSALLLLGSLAGLVAAGCFAGWPRAAAATPTPR